MAVTVEERRFRILLVEDEPVNIGVILEYLGHQYQIYIAKTREKALSILKKETIDIVLLDINLPDGNGFDICRELVDNKRDFGELSIVFMTGMDNPEDEARGIELGARDYITKPINGTVLIARLELQCQLIRQTELLSNLARIDGLTEINNRRAFDDQLPIEWNRAMRESTPLCLCLLDIDYFKRYNDTYGHPAGDKCLKAVAKSLSNRFKRGSDFISRYGGEEFALILAKTELHNAQRILEDSLEALKALKIPHAASEASHVVTFSAGICCSNPNNQDERYDISTFLEKADEALYQAKESGRARIKTLTLP